MEVQIDIGHILQYCCTYNFMTNFITPEIEKKNSFSIYLLKTFSKGNIFIFLCKIYDLLSFKYNVELDKNTITVYCIVLLVNIVYYCIVSSFWIFYCKILFLTLKIQFTIFFVSLCWSHSKSCSGRSTVIFLILVCIVKLTPSIIL